MQKNTTKYFRVLAMVLLSCMLLFATGCSQLPFLPEFTLPAFLQPTEPTQPSQTTPVATQPSQTSPVDTQPQAGDSSLSSLRQAMVGTSQLFAVAYFGYHDTIDSDQPVNPYEAMQATAPQLCEDLPFLLQIPAEQIVEPNGELYCIVPLDENATVVISRCYWDEENLQYIYDDTVYCSTTGEPILLFCNNSGWDLDTQVYISGPSGEAYWYPFVDDNRCAAPLYNDAGESLLYDFSSYREMLLSRHRDMKGSEWILPTTEMLEGTSWFWEGFLKDGRWVSYRLFFEEDVLTVRWNDGIYEMGYEYAYAPWELTYEDDYAILSIDFGDFAGILRYNLLYHEVYEQLYVALDVLQEDMNTGWEPLFRFLMPPSIPDPVDMAGNWELVWYEVEGSLETAEPGAQQITITTDYAGLYWIDYTNNEQPDQSFHDKELVVFPFALYDSCENNQWSATANYTGRHGMEYTLTLLPDGYLLLQNYWEFEGFRMVSYHWYQRVG